MWADVRGSLRRWLLVGVVLLLVISAGVVALIGADRATASQEVVHRQDRLALTGSLATLAAGYFAQLEGAQSSVAAAVPYNLSAAALTAAVAKLPGAPEAVLVGPTGSPLVASTDGAPLVSAWPRLGDLLGPQMAGGGVAISDVQSLAGHPVVVVAVHGAPQSIGSLVLVVSYRLDDLPIAAYVRQLRIGVGAQPYLVDASGRLVTSPDTNQVGRLAPPAVRSAVAARRTGGVVQTGGSSPQVVAVAAAGMPGWYLVTIQPAPLFYGVLWHADNLFRWLLLAVLIVVAGALLMLHAKRQAALHAIAEMAVRDPLTGLPNRVAFTEALAGAMDRHRRDHSDLALLFCDLDGFKAVNDQLGHDAGDLLLVAVARRLDDVAAAATGVAATAARLGGDEFTVLLEGRQVRSRAGAVAETITDALAAPFQLGADQVTVGVSVGIAYAHPDRDILHDADVAMYRTKAVRKAGREAGSPDRFSANPPGSLRAV